jgi:hypothetical protein
VHAGADCDVSNATPAQGIYEPIHPIRRNAVERKTKRWSVDTLNGILLGHVQWYGQWRQYSFFPHDATVFERKCLRDIASFCEMKTREHLRLPRLTLEQKVG